MAEHTATLKLPWVEKYRPKSLSDVVGQETITKRLESYVKTRDLPHLMFAGHAGIGKTSAAIALAKELFGEEYTRNFLELNASDDRGIDVVRSTIKEFARTLAFNSDFKIIFLDECDALTTDAQQALRRTMEKYSKTARFILSCNYSSRIIEPIQSRCVVFRFKPLRKVDLEKQIHHIAKQEGISVDAKAIDALEYVAEGDLRKAINVLQAASSLEKKITEDIVYSVANRAKPKEIKEMIALAMEGKFLPAREKLDVLMLENGLSGEDVIKQIHKEVLDWDEKEMDSKTKIRLVDRIGEYDFRLVEGANERIQIEALLAQIGLVASEKK
jgi:replication factor C small subunit